MAHFAKLGVGNIVEQVIVVSNDIATTEQAGSDFINKDLNLFPNGIMQSNESFSHKNVLRGLHFQWNPNMGKLVRTIVGHNDNQYLQNFF